MLYDIIKFPDILLEDSTIIVTLNISDSGVEFTNKTIETLVTHLDEDYCSGILITGDSISNSNRATVRDLVRTLRAIFGDSKKIILDTHKTVDDIISIKDSITDEILRYVDSV